MGRLAWLAFAVAVVGGPASAQASVVWRGDYETGDWSQWSKAQVVSNDRMQAVTSPVRQGRYAMKVTVRQGDNPIGASGNRNELVYLSYEPAGTERWYRWQTMWPADYPSDAPWQIFTQWHHSGSDGSPPMVFSVRGETVRMLANTEVVWTTPLVRGVWHDFLFHVKWSPNASEGFVELWYDGQLVLPKTYTPTQFAGQTNYLKQGLYRDDTIASSATIFHDGMVMGTTRADVEDVALPVADAGALPAAADASAAAQPGPDAAAPGADAAPAGPDAAPPGPDAAPAGPDAAEPGPDAQELGPDAQGSTGASPWPDQYGQVPGIDTKPPAGADAAMGFGADVGQVPPNLPLDPYEGVGCTSVPGGLFAGLAFVALGVLVQRRRR